MSRTSGRTEVRPKSISLEKLVDSATANLCKHLSATDEKGKFTTATITMLTAGWVGQNSSRQRLTQLVLSSGYIEDLKLRASESGKAVALKETLTLSLRQERAPLFPVRCREAGANQRNHAIRTGPKKNDEVFQSEPHKGQVEPLAFCRAIVLRTPI
jgi:hypothetical protein